MNLNRIIILAIFAGIIAAATGLRLGPSQASDDNSITQAAPPKPVSSTQFRGIALQLHNPDELAAYSTLIRQIGQTNANTICLVVHAQQENASSASIFMDSRKTPSDTALTELITLAHEQDLRVILMPIVLLENARSGEWRGKINPPNWDSWWEDYANFILHFAKLSARTDTEIFMVGSELVSTEKQTDRWRNLISKVRSVYPGLISYSSNWDHYRPIKWWDAVDVIGMTTYYDLTGGDKPTLEKLAGSWKSIKSDILTWHGKNFPQLPILFTEVGWPNQVTCAQFPWNYYQSPDRPDPQAQANCFEAFFDAWITVPAVAGFIVWEWMNHPDQEIGPHETSYVPAGKPAMEVIEKFYQMPAAIRVPIAKVSGNSQDEQKQIPSP